MLAQLNETLEARVDAGVAERKLLADIVESTDAFVQVFDLEYRFIAINRAGAREFEQHSSAARPKVGDSMPELLENYRDNLAMAKSRLGARTRRRGVHRDRAVWTRRNATRATTK